MVQISPSPPTPLPGGERGEVGGSPLQPLRPPLDLAQNLCAGAALAVGQAGTEAVLPPYFVPGDDILKVPRRVRGLQVRVGAAAAGRMRETHVRRPLEQEDGRHVAEVAVEDRGVVAQG